jgi:diguanylate cyclase (GGDEF)-like protein
MACFVELSSNKERTTLEQSVVKTLCQFLKCELYLLRLYDGRGEYTPQVVLHGQPNSHISFESTSLEEIGEDLELSVRDYLVRLNNQLPENIFEQHQWAYWPLYSGENCIDLLVIKKETLSQDDIKLLKAIACIFSNFMALLDAGERDALTGLYNRRLFDTRLSTLIHSTSNRDCSTAERRQEHDQKFNFLGIIDIDFFKRVNDDYGHLFGDEVLLWMAKHMRQCFRNEDALFRYGGEEFAVLLTGLSQQQAEDAFERFRERIATTDFPQIGQITVSVGYAQIDHQANPTLVFGAADKALYYAKEHGRNRVECYHRLLDENKIGQEQQDNEDIELF